MHRPLETATNYAAWSKTAQEAVVVVSCSVVFVMRQQRGQSAAQWPTEVLEQKAVLPFHIAPCCSIVMMSTVLAASDIVHCAFLLILKQVSTGMQ
jgi:hypothetical protein